MFLLLMHSALQPDRIVQDCQFGTFQEHQMCVEKTLASADWVPNFQVQTWLFNVVSLADFLNVTFQCPI